MINDTILHGEAMITQIKSLPKNAKQVHVDGDLIIADSETTGNHHVVEQPEGVEFYELDGIRYMKNSSPTNVKCVMEDRHSTVEIPAGTWEFGIQQEYDYFEDSHRAVRD